MCEVFCSYFGTTIMGVSKQSVELGISPANRNGGTSRIHVWKVLIRPLNAENAEHIDWLLLLNTFCSIHMWTQLTKALLHTGAASTK
jgi:hypothetical protein